MDNIINKEDKLLQECPRAPGMEISERQHEQSETHLSAPVLAKSASYIQVAMAGIGERNSGNATSASIAPDSCDISLDSMNIRGPNDVQSDIAPASCSALQVANLAENNDHCHPTISSSPVSAGGIETSDPPVEETTIKRAPLPRITTFGVATNIAFDYPEIAKEVLSLPIGSDAEALLGHMIKAKPSPADQPSTLAQTTPPVPLSNSPSVHASQQAHARQRSSKRAKKGSAAPSAPSAPSAPPSPIVPTSPLPADLYVRRARNGEPHASQTSRLPRQQNPEIQDYRFSQNADTNNDWRSHAQNRQDPKLHQQHASPVLRTSKSRGSMNPVHDSSSSLEPQAGERDIWQPASGFSPTPSAPTDADVWRMMLDECRAQNAAGLVDELHAADSSAAQGIGSGQRRASLPLPAPEDKSDEARWHSYAAHSTSSAGCAPSGHSQTPERSPIDVWSTLYSNSQYTHTPEPNPGHQQRHSGELEDVRLAYDTYPEHQQQYAPSQDAFYGHHMLPAAPQARRLVDHRHLPLAQQRQPDNAYYGSPYAPKEDLIASAASLRVRTPSQKEVAALAYAHASKILRAQGLYNKTPASDRSDPSAHASGGIPTGHHHHIGGQNRQQPMQDVPRDRQQFFPMANAAPFIPMANAAPFSSNSSMSGASGHRGEEGQYSLVEYTGAAGGQAGSRSYSQEEVTAILTRHLMAADEQRRAEDERRRAETAHRPPQYAAPRRFDDGAQQGW
ncbi:hypothetical protein BD626DRAFT_481058 [Schizophyllum amplum]|uniref:Uncharacterized protein n=1 Tax=Schizophyllum amplum TaxID=97359 RepID=A0A550CTT4_9AGAR|nr:hypothetical protein BD626DRAFT_481058 [Auriculariopsis ampla]